MDKTYLTKERYEEIKEDLKYLKSKESQKIAKRLKEAKELGDLSENSEYQEARNDKIELDRKINRLEEIIRNSEIIKKSKKSDKVRIGSQVEIKKDGNKDTYTIVGSSEANPKEGRISNESPLGKKLLGGKTGDEITFNTPKGEKVFKILKIK